MNSLRWFWGNLRTSFWFLPSMSVVFSIGLAAPSSTTLCQFKNRVDRAVAPRAPDRPHGRTYIMDA